MDQDEELKDEDELAGDDLDMTPPEGMGFEDEEEEMSPERDH